MVRPGGAVPHCLPGRRHVDALGALASERWTLPYDYLEDAALELYRGYTSSVAGVNDSLGHEAVLKVYDRALERLTS